MVIWHTHFRPCCLSSSLTPSDIDVSASSVHDQSAFRRRLRMSLTLWRMRGDETEKVINRVEND
jgi:hypothetical protein